MLLDNRQLQRLEQLTLATAGSFSGLIGGHRAARHAGNGQEFLDHRNFYAGDDLKAVNWRAYMRFDRFFLKTFQTEPRVPIRILLDVSASMSVGAKLDFARRFTAALAYVGLVRLEWMQLVPFGAELHRPLSVGGGRQSFPEIDKFLAESHSHGRSNFPAVIREFVSEYPQRGLAIVVSDFLDANGECVRALELLCQAGHEAAILQVVADEDRNPPVGDFEFEDAESGATRRITVDSAAQARYQAAFDAHSNELKRLALKHKGRYQRFAVETPLLDAVQCIC